MTTATNEDATRAAYEAYSQGDIDALLAVFSPDLEWTYLDPSVENPGPQVCRGLPEMGELSVVRRTRPQGHGRGDPR